MEMDRILSCIFEFAFVICWLHLLTLQLSPGAPGTIWTAASSTSLQASVSSSPTLNQNKSFCLSCLSLSEGLGLFPLFFCAAARQAMANNKKTNIALILSKSTQSKVKCYTSLTSSEWVRLLSSVSSKSSYCCDNNQTKWKPTCIEKSGPIFELFKCWRLSTLNTKHYSTSILE